VSADIFDFWTNVRGDARVHPADEKVLERSEHGFCLDCLPSNIDGNLKEASVVLLFVNPGMNEIDLTEATDHKAHAKYKEMRAGNRPLRGEEDASRAYKWLLPITKDFGPWDVVQKKAAVLNIAAYHSREFKSPHMLAALPSCRVCLDWAQSVLFPQAVAGKLVVICLRAASYWGLRHKDQRRFGETLFAPLTSRGGHMLKGNEREAVVAAARRALGTA
jgi:hypothetical protein